jgi:hypothetical protein
VRAPLTGAVTTGHFPAGREEAAPVSSSPARRLVTGTGVWLGLTIRVDPAQRPGRWSAGQRHVGVRRPVSGLPLTPRTGAS